MITGKMICCWVCGAEIGLKGDRFIDPHNTCGRSDCEREARDQDRAEREEAHRRLDRDLGYLE